MLEFNELLFRTLAGIAGGIIYYYIMEASIPKETNCSFSASLTTDVLAFLVGGYLAHHGATNDFGTVYTIGIAITVEHLAQAIQHKLPSMR